MYLLINNSNYMMILTDLPTELLVEIFNHTDYDDIVSVSEVCKKFYDIVTNFSWNQLCVIDNMLMPNNIQFSSYFLNISHLVLGIDIDTFCSDQLLFSKPFKTVVINSSFTNQKFFNYLQTTECQNIIVLGDINVYDLCLCGNFNFYLQSERTIDNLLMYNPNNVSFQKYNIISHFNIFKNVLKYDVINNSNICFDCFEHHSFMYQCKKFMYDIESYSFLYPHTITDIFHRDNIRPIYSTFENETYTLPVLSCTYQNNTEIYDNIYPINNLTSNSKKSRHEKYIDRSKHKKNNYPNNQYKRSNNFIKNRKNTKFTKR